MPKLNINDLYKRRVKELVGNPDDVKRIEAGLDKEWSPEQWYQELKKRWYFHMTSWYMLQEREHTQDIRADEGCNPSGCIEQCEFYAQEGRREPQQIQQMIKVLSSFPAVQEAEKEFEEQIIKRPLSSLLRQVQEEKELFKLLRNQPFWIWYRHLHLLQFLRTQRRCCFNHIICEPQKHGKLYPLF